VSRVWGTVVRRPLQRYNVDHRAERVVNKIQDPKAAPMRAPMYQSDAELLEEIRRTKPEVAASAVRKDVELHTRLKQVRVESTDPDLPPPEAREHPNRPFPRDTSQYSYDFVPAQLRQDSAGRAGRRLPRGKVTLQQSVDFLTKHKATQGGYGHIDIAEQYRLNPELVAHSLQHCFIFGAFETSTRPSEGTMPDPLVAQADWVERVKAGPQEPFKQLKDEAEQLRLMAERQKARVEEEKARLGEGPRS